MPKPDITYRVAPEDYERALVADGERWQDAGTPVWQGRRVWRLGRFVTERAHFRVLAYTGNLTVHPTRGAA